MTVASVFRLVLFFPEFEIYRMRILSGHLVLLSEILFITNLEGGMELYTEAM